MISVTGFALKLKISKMMVYRSINNNEITENKSKEEFFHINDNDVIIDMMKSEIEIKNKQIYDLTEMNKALNMTLQQQQQLLLYEQQKNTKLLEENIENKKWWQWWK